MRSWLFVGLAACGSVDSKPPDAAVSKIDAQIDGPGSGSGAPCDVTKPFGTPVVVMGVTSPSGHERFGFLSGDELTVYFSDVAGDRSVFSATRASTNDPFSNSGALSNNTASSNEHPAVTSDNLILITDTNAFNASADIAVATRASVSQAFGAFTSLPVVNSTTTNETDPFISADGKTLLFGSNRNNSDYSVFMATRASVANNFGAPTEITALNAVGSTDSGAALSADGLEIFLYSDRPGGQGATDIWRATRPTTASMFGTPMNVTELNTANIETTGWLSPDRCRFLFSSDRLGTYDLFMATRPK